MGFVDNLSEFYNKIDIALNPAIVQGGLNFKSIEAILSGKLLWTNHLGSKCINDNDLIDIISTPNDIEHLLTEIEISDHIDDKIKYRQDLALKHLVKVQYMKL